MSQLVYRYEFPETSPIAEVEASLLLALIGAESLHGETATRLEAPHVFDKDRRICVIDAEATAGKDFNALFAGYLRKEFGPDAFTVRRVGPDDVAAPTHRASE